MKPLLRASLLLMCTASGAWAQEKPAIFVSPTGDGFDVYLTAAMNKKNVPATVVTTSSGATLTLKAAQVQVQKESARMKVMKCVMQSCANTEDKASTSVQLMDKTGAVLWSYALDSDDASRKSMAETIAKRLKHDYFRQ